MEPGVMRGDLKATAGVGAGHGPAFDFGGIWRRYEEKGLLRRLRDMFSGLGRPRGTPEYKLARLELQRQTAPLVAVVAVVLAVAVLCVATSLPDGRGAAYLVKLRPQDDIPQLLDFDEPFPPPDPEPVPLPDLPSLSPDLPPAADLSVPLPSPPSERVSVKPASADAVAFVRSPVKMRSMAGSRNPGAIGAATRGGSGAGDPNTEAAVLKVLWWLKSVQRPDGSWEASAWNGGKASNSRIANTAFALLAFLAHGEHEGSLSPYRRDFGPVVSSAVEYLAGRLDLRDPARPRMRGCDKNEYAFLIAAYALCETYGMTKNPQCKELATAMIGRIISSQSATGGWDYKLDPTTCRDDLSYGGWALQALKAAKMAGMRPEGLDACIKKAVRCLKERNFHGDHFGYTAKRDQHPGLTATGCLGMQLLGYSGESEVKKSLEYMSAWHPSFTKAGVNVGDDSLCPQYYCYYATQCKYHAGMRQGAGKSDEAIWFAWNQEMKRLYISAITDLPAKAQDWKGGEHRQGYYPCGKVEDKWSNDVMNSCLVALQLMVYYRYLPTNQLKASEEVEGDAAAMMSEEGDVEVEVDI